MTTTINQTNLDKLASLLKGDLYLKTNGNMHGGEVILTTKAYNKNAKIAKIIVNEKLKADQDVFDFIIDNVVTIDVSDDDYYFVRINHTDSLIVEFTCANGFSVETSEFHIR